MAPFRYGLLSDLSARRPPAEPGAQHSFRYPRGRMAAPAKRPTLDDPYELGACRTLRNWGNVKRCVAFRGSLATYDQRMLHAAAALGFDIVGVG
jgi:hypothetical protein